MNDIRGLSESSIEVIAELDEARRAHVANILTLAEAEQNLALTAALAESRAIVAAGGEKALGPNADARKRALLIALSDDETYREARARSMQALGDARLARACVAALEDTLGLFKVLLYANAGRKIEE